MSVVRFAPLLLVALGLSACAGAPSPDAVGRSSTGPGGDAPLAALPAAAGRVVAVRRTAYANGLSEQIVLDGPRAMAGENRISVEALTGSGTGWRGAAGDDELKIATPSDTTIAAEMETQLPGMRMRISAEAGRNARGPFGYAVGSAGSLTCVYAWQYLAPAHALTLLEGASNTGSHAMSLRVRLCRDEPAAALVEDVRRLTMRQEDGIITSAMERGLTGGDALETAIGALPAAAAGPEARPTIGAEMADAGAVRYRRPRPTFRRRPSRHAPRVARHVSTPRFQPISHGALRAWTGDRALRAWTGDRALRAWAGDGALGLPRVPLPSDVGTGTAMAAPRAIAHTATPPRSAALDSDAMPMPMPR